MRTWSLGKQFLAVTTKILYASLFFNFFFLNCQIVLTTQIQHGPIPSHRLELAQQNAEKARIAREEYVARKQREHEEWVAGGASVGSYTPTKTSAFTAVGTKKKTTFEAPPPGPSRQQPRFKAECLEPDGTWTNLGLYDTQEECKRVIQEYKDNKQ